VLGACKRYSDLVQVRRDFKCSAAWLCSTLYEQLELERRKRLYPWQWKVGIDEHFFRRGKQGFRGFVTVIVDQKSHRLMEVIEGRTGGELRAALESIPGRENVRIVTIDMSDPYRSLVRGFFPNAVIVADKFHVLRLLSPQPPRQRHHRRQAHQPHPPPLAPQGRDLDATSRWALRAWLTKHPVLRALHEAKERLSNFYRIRRHEQADRGLTAFTDSLSAPVLGAPTFTKITEHQPPC
jgi:transposase